jgi:signal transduction histidine kinase
MSIAGHSGFRFHLKTRYAEGTKLARGGSFPPSKRCPKEMASSPVNLLEDVMTSSVAEESSLKHEIDDIVRQSQELAVAGQYAAAIMHEINGPLEAVTNLNYLIQQEADDATRVRQYSKLLDEQIVTLTKLSHQTLSLYKSPEIREPIAISTLAEAALRVHQKKITAKQIQLRKRLPPDVTAEVHAGDLLQVLSNLISNAVYALPESGTLGLSVKGDTREVHVTVADNGPGIPAPMLTKIFDPFFTTKRERGTGLGLAISKAIIDKHDGRIRTRSNMGPIRHGTAFRISLPLYARPAAAAR